MWSCNRAIILGPQSVAAEYGLLVMCLRGFNNALVCVALNISHFENRHHALSVQQTDTGIIQKISIFCKDSSVCVFMVCVIG